MGRPALPVEEAELSQGREFQARDVPREKRPSSWRSAVIGLVGAACLLTAAPVHAALGGGYNSVEADRAHLAARMSSVGSGAFTVHTLSLNNGLVREYTRSDGTVFAVTWQGPARPDLRQLLGVHFTTFQSDNALQRGRRARRPLLVNRSDFVVRTGGHSGAFFGVAVLPQVAPAGFSASELR